MFRTVVTFLAMALIAVGRTTAKHRYCGNALVMHVGKICSEVDCEAVDLSVPRMKYVGKLFLRNDGSVDII